MQQNSVLKSSVGLMLLMLFSLTSKRSGRRHRWRPLSPCISHKTICKPGHRTLARGQAPARVKAALDHRGRLAQGQGPAALARRERPALDPGKVAPARRGHPVLLPRLGRLRVAPV